MTGRAPNTPSAPSGDRTNQQCSAILSSFTFDQFIKHVHLSTLRSGKRDEVQIQLRDQVTTLLTSVAVASICVDTAQVHATHKQKHDDRGSVYYYGPAGPNVSYRSGPHTRIYVTKRSWLDAGTEILPRDRKFTDYAFPPGYSFGRENRNRPIDRQPLDPPSDMGGYPQTIPLY